MLLYSVITFTLKPQKYTFFLYQRGFKVKITVTKPLLSQISIFFNRFPLNPNGLAIKNKIKNQNGV